MAYFPVTLTVKDVRRDAPNLKTYIFERNLRAKPGQFIMVWLPDVDEVPMSVGWQTSDFFEVGIASAGDCTNKLNDEIKPGDKLGIRGPYGNGFTLQPDAKHIVVIGGGYGTPPLLLLAQAAREKDIKVTAILGARSKDYLIYEDKFKQIGCDIKVSTDDGTKGHKGYNTEVLEELLQDEKPDAIYTCGPEKMMVKVALMGKENDIFTEVSLERFMKCGFGACGQCCLDDSGIRVCKEGPVLEGNFALEHKEFGQYTRTCSGKCKPM